MAKKQLAFIYTSRSSFVNRDIEILRNRFEVIEHPFRTKNKWLTPFAFFMQLAFLLKISFSCKIVLVQFGGYHSFLPTLLSKFLGFKCVIIAGGVDCVYYPEINYGYMGDSLISYFTKYSFKNCRLILPKHKSLIAFDDFYNSPNGIKQGLKYHIKGFNTPVKTIHNGYDGNVFKKHCKEKEPNSYVTMALGLEKVVNQRLKGIDLILDCAADFPNSKFIIIGGTNIINISHIPPNVTLLPPLNQEALIEILSRSQYYLQLSMSEGFPNSVCEAMLCECIPIGSAVNAIPEIIGTTGYILNKKDRTELNSILSKSSNHYSETAGKLCRERILQHFGIENRAKQLLDSIEST